MDQQQCRAQGAEHFLSPKSYIHYKLSAAFVLPKRYQASKAHQRSELLITLHFQ